MTWMRTPADELGHIHKHTPHAHTEEGAHETTAQANTHTHTRSAR